MIPGWRAQIHYWSRQSGFLKRLAVGIVAFGFFGALAIVALAPDSGSFASINPQVQYVRKEWQELHRAKKPMPHELVRWLNDVTENIHLLCLAQGIKITTWQDYLQDGHLAGHETRPLLTQHSTDAATIQLWEEFIHAALNRDTALMGNLGTQAAQESPPITANLIHSYLLAESAPPASLAALIREGTLFPQSGFVRQEALHQAVVMKDGPALRQIAAQTDWWEAMPTILRLRAAAEMDDFRLQWQTLLEYRSLLDAPAGPLAIALLAAFIWYVVLVLHGLHSRWRWVAPLLPLLAGIFSVWPIFMIASWQEVALGMQEHAPFPQDLWYQIGGVGMREECSKLLLASLFMPWLLHKRQAGGAIMVGAFVGLGFALEENISYYVNFDSGVPLTRFFTANFFHAALTGTSTHALYQLLRSRFGTADRFLMTLLGVVLAHGVYNYSFSIIAIQGMEYVSMVILAFTAWQFLDLIEHECPRARQWVSPAAVFIIGTAVLMAVIFLSIAIRTPDRQLVIAAAMKCVSILPIAFIYWRRLGA